MSGILVGIARADPALGRADLLCAGMLFLQLILINMIGHDDVRAVRDPDVVTGKPALLEHADLLQQHERIDDHARADHALRLLMQHSGRQQMEDEFLSVHDDRMACVVAALETDDRIGVLAEDVDDLSFSLVTPLGADYYSTWHFFHLFKLSKNAITSKLYAFHLICQSFSDDGRILPFSPPETPLFPRWG